MSDPRLIAEAERWMRFAVEDLDQARTLARGGSPRQVCFSAQQAAEKALKAVLVFNGLPVPRTHDLDLVARLIPPGWSCAAVSADLTWLSRWATFTRYPGDWPEGMPGDATKAVAEASQVLSAVLEDLAGHTPLP